MKDYLKKQNFPFNNYLLPFRLIVETVSISPTGMRVISGSITSGTIRKNDTIIALSSAQSSRINHILIKQPSQYKSSSQAVFGQSVRLVLEEGIDISPGDVIAPVANRPEVADQLAAHLTWLGESAMLPGRAYLLHIGTTRIGAQITELKHKVHAVTRERLAAKYLEREEIAFCNLALEREIPFDPYEDNPALGSFTLLDRHSETVVARGTIAFALRRAANIHRQAMKVDKHIRSVANGHKPCVLWFTGLSGAGKSTVADLVEQRLQALGKRTMTLDGDNVRHGLNRDLGFTTEDRVENIRRIGEVSKLMVEAGLITLVSFISPFRSERQMVRELLEEGEFYEIFVDAPLDVCEARDPKGLYKKARAGKLPNFTGIDSPYEPPALPELHLQAGDKPPDVLADQVVAMLREQAILSE